MYKNTIKTILVIIITIVIIINYLSMVNNQMYKSLFNKTDEQQITKSNTISDSTIFSNMESHKNLSYELPNEPSYILRLDDVQSPTWSDVSIRIINDTLSKNMSISIAIIPSRNDQGTSNIISYINENKNNENLEIMQHGFKHTYYEYDNISSNVTQNYTISGLRQLQKDYDTYPVTFIPPNNAINSVNNTTVNTLYDMGFRIISTDGDTRYEGNILNVGCHVATNGKRQHNADEIVNACKKDFEKQNLSVIMIHPQDFVGDDRRTLDPIKYSMYLEMLEDLNNTNAQSITFRDLLTEGNN